MSEPITIKVMVPVEVDVSVNTSGRVRIHGFTYPTLNDIAGFLQAFPRFAEIASDVEILTVLPDWIICKK